MSQAKKYRPIKAKWEFVPAPDAEAFIEAAFDIIFNHMEEPRTDNLLLSASSDAEDQDVVGDHAKP